MINHVVLMGVCGSGKTKVGELLAPIVDLPYRDGDEFHPAANIAKMESGHPLNDEDRWPWLELVGDWLKNQERGGIIGCSALKRSYRDLLRSRCPGLYFIHLDGSKDLLFSRLSHRQGHFMPASMLDSQLATLEPLGADEAGAVVDISPTAESVANTVAELIKQTR